MAKSGGVAGVDGVPWSCGRTGDTCASGGDPGSTGKDGGCGATVAGYSGADAGGSEEPA